MKWTENEIEILKNNLNIGYYELSMLLNRNSRSIRKKVKRLGLVNYYEFNGGYLDSDMEKQRRSRISQTCKINKKSGGFRRGSGRGKKGTYKGYWCDSSYELAWVIYNIEHNIEFERNTEKFKYIYGGVERNFIPDFIVGNVYYEIKGYADAKLEYKIKYFPHELKILYGEDLDEIFNYVIYKYGKNYISLYEDKEYKGCSKCGGYICKVNISGVCKNCLKENKKVKVKNNNIRVYKFKKCSCGETIYLESNMCKKCRDLSQRKAERPSLNNLSEDINKLGYSATGRKYSVSDTTIRRWIRKI